MRLSIAMIVRNEEKNLAEALKAINEVANKIDIEIIVVDTGSTDSTIEIAKKYTEKIFLHNWEDDFAKMRNISLKYCTGEWILVLDADEVLDNPEEFIKVLNNESIEEYNTISVKIKSYNNSLKEKSSIGIVYRLFKRSSNVKYFGAIHESPICLEPIFESDIIFSHYGYIKDDYELMEHKFRRDTELLKKHIENNGDDIYAYFQLSQSYFSVNKTIEAINYNIKAINMVEGDSRLYKENLFVYALYYKELFAIKDYDKCIEICKKVMMEEKNILDIYYLMSCSYYANKNYYDTIKYANEYFYYKENPGKKNIKIEEFSIDKEEDIIEVLALSYEKLGDYKSVYNLLKNKDLEKETLLEAYCISLVMLDKIGNIRRIIDLNNSDKIVSYLIDAINKMQTEVDIKYKNNILKKFLGINDTLDLYINIVGLNKNIRVDEINFAFKSYEEWKERILLELIKSDEVNINILFDLDYEDIRRYLLLLTQDYSCIKILLDYSKNRLFTNNLKELMILDHIEENLIQCNKISGEDLNALINRRLVNKYNLMNKIYNKEILEMDRYKNLLSNEEVFWYKLRKIMNKKEKKIEDFIKDLKLHVKEFNSYKNVYKFVSSDIKFINNEELMKEKDKVIEMINNLVNSGEIESSKAMLRELKEIVGNTSEIYNIEGVIYYIEGEIDKALNSFLNGYILDCNYRDIIYNINEILKLIGRNRDVIIIEE